MKHFAIASFLFLAIQACQPLKPTNSETESIVLNRGKWPNPKAIPVCVMNLRELGAELFNDVRDFTNREYANKAGVAFTGWGECTASDRNARMIRVYFNRVHNWDSGGGVSAGGGLSWVGPNAGSCGSCNGGTMRIDIGRSGNYPNGGLRQFTIDQTRATVIHEFGHALGLLHEHERTDAPACNDIETRQRAGGATVYVGNYDPNSIMNYCKNRGITTLSAGDVAGIRFLYPALGGGMPGGTPNNGSIPNNPTNNPPPARVPANSFYLVLRNSGKCVDVSNSSKENQGNIQLWDCNQTSAQIWQLLDAGAGSFNLRNINSQKCADVAFSGRESGADIFQYDCHGTVNQRIYLQPTNGGYYRMVFAHSNKCLDVDKAGSATGSNIHQWDCLQNAPWQEVRFVRAN